MTVDDVLCHHGIDGQKWGVRHGPPYPLKKSLSKRIRRRSDKQKRYGQYTIRKEQRVQTLSVNPKRQHEKAYTFAAVTPRDRIFYKTFFNTPFSKVTKEPPKFIITSKAAANMRVANEKDGISAFKTLYDKSPGFRRWMTSDDGVESLVGKKQKTYKSYREGQSALDAVQAGKKPSAKDYALMYRMFNLTFPAVDAPNVSRYCNEFFDELKKNGFSAFLDTNDSLYGKFKRDMAVVIIDCSKLEPESVVQGLDLKTTIKDVERFLKGER